MNGSDDPGQESRSIRSCFFVTLIWTLGFLPAQGGHAADPAPAWDLSKDFSNQSNPNGVWTYGYSETLGGPVTPILFAKNFASDNGVPISDWQLSANQNPSVCRVMGNATAVSAGGMFVGPPGTVWFAPGGDGTPQNFGVIRLTVPPAGDGNYRIETAVRSTFDGASSGDTDFHVVQNGRELFGRFLAPNSATGFTNTVSLAAGDTIDFAVGRGQDGLAMTTVDGVNKVDCLKIQATLTRVTDQDANPIVAALARATPRLGVLLVLLVLGAALVAGSVYLIVRATRQKSGATAPPWIPPSPSAPASDLEQELRLLAKLKTEGLITEEDYNAKKKALLGL